MYEERIAQLNAGLSSHEDKIQMVLGIVNFLYRDLGLMGQISSIDGPKGKDFEIILIDKPATSVDIRKTYKSDGSTSDWEAIDLTAL